MWPAWLSLVRLRPRRARPRFAKRLDDPPEVPFRTSRRVCTVRGPVDWFWKPDQLSEASDDEGQESTQSRSPGLGIRLRKGSVRRRDVIKADVRPRRGTRLDCLDYGRRDATYDHLMRRRFAFVPRWGIRAFL